MASQHNLLLSAVEHVSGNLTTNPFIGVISDYRSRIQDLLMDLEDIERVRKDLVSTIFENHRFTLEGSVASPLKGKLRMERTSTELTLKSSALPWRSGNNWNPR